MTANTPYCLVEEEHRMRWCPRLVSSCLFYTTTSTTFTTRSFVRSLALPVTVASILVNNPIGAFSLPDNNHSIRKYSTNPIFSTPQKIQPTMSDLKRGPGGRLEDAFASAKERGEAAFVTFVTAGYPSAEGKKSMDRK